MKTINVDLNNATVKPEPGLKGTKVNSYDAIRGKQAEYRQILWLTFFENMSAEEASLVMHKSKNNVHHLILRAKRALKDELQQEGFVYEGQ